MLLPDVREMTVDAFEAALRLPENRDRHLELIDGVMVEKAIPTEEHKTIAGLCIYYFNSYTLPRGWGVAGPEEYFRLPGDLRNTRQPDVTLTLDLNREPVTEGPTLTTPDVIIEIKSPDDTYEDMREKARYYIAQGAKLVLLCFPRPRTMEVYRPDHPSEVLSADDTLDGCDLLPGFSVPVAQLFPRKRGG
jgi:Uma2 family endonuclease